jgi:hypothetical protein
MQAGGQRAGLGLSIAHHHQRDQVRVIIDRPIRVREAIAKFAALVDAAGRFRGGVTADSAWKRELLEESLYTRHVFVLIWVDFGIGAFEIRL